MSEIENATECTICYEHTTNKTECDHIICKTCMTKINKCAVCRKEFTVIVTSQEFIDDLNRRVRYINRVMICCCISTSFGLLMIVVFLMLYYQIKNL